VAAGRSKHGLKLDGGVMTLPGRAAVECRQASAPRSGWAAQAASSWCARSRCCGL